MSGTRPARALTFLPSPARRSLSRIPTSESVPVVPLDPGARSPSAMSTPPGTVPRCSTCSSRRAAWSAGHRRCPCARRVRRRSSPPSPATRRTGLDAVWSLVDYEGSGRDLVTSLKYDGRRDAVRVLGTAMAHLLDRTVDVVTWAPTSAVASSGPRLRPGAGPRGGDRSGRAGQAPPAAGPTRGAHPDGARPRRAPARTSLRPQGPRAAPGARRRRRGHHRSDVVGRRRGAASRGCVRGPRAHVGVGALSTAALPAHSGARPAAGGLSSRAAAPRGSPPRACGRRGRAPCPATRDG